MNPNYGIFVPNPSLAELTKPCEKASLDLGEATQIIALLERELAKIGSQGIGLAAPQIGIYKQVAIVRIGKVKLNLINPVILSQKDKTILPAEGCLSFPKITKRTARYNEIVVQSDIAPYKFLATGLVSYCCQHEIDHLNQKTIFDRAL